MDDIIGQGEDRPPPSWRRRLLVGGVLVVVGALLVVEHLPKGSHRAPVAAQVPVRHHARRAEPPLTIRVHVTGPGSLPPGILGGTVPWARTARVPRTGSRPVWFWPSKGRIAPILGLPSDRAGYEFTRVGGGWAIQPVGRVSCPGCAGPVEPVYYLPVKAARAVLVGSANDLAPAATSDRLWLVSYPPRTDLASATGIAREYTTTGAAVGSAVTLPTGFEITQVTRYGMLLAPAGSGGTGARAELWNPATRQVLSSFDGIVAASANSIAYAPDCVVTCAVYVRELAARRTQVVDVASGSEVTGAEFSPDGRYLALRVNFADGGDGGDLATRLEVAQVATGFLSAIPRTFAGGDALLGFGWPDNADDLVARFDVSSRIQLAYWNLDKATLGLVSLRRDQAPAELVVG